MKMELKKLAGPMPKTIFEYILLLPLNLRGLETKTNTPKQIKANMKTTFTKKRYIKRMINLQ